MTIDRRGFLGAAALLTASPVLFAQAATERFVFIIQRGAADGLNTVIPYAEPAYARLRGALAVDPASSLKLDGMFALHPSLPKLGELYAAGEASFFHAIASPYRDRSHFDGQNVLETGGSAAYQVKDGWMNRLVGLLPPSALPQANEDLMLRVEQLYAKDSQLHALWSSALDARGMAGEMSGSERRQDPAALGRIAAGFLARADGPRIAMVETTGWDTHSGRTRASLPSSRASTT